LRGGVGLLDPRPVCLRLRGVGGRHGPPRLGVDGSERVGQQRGTEVRVQVRQAGSHEYEDQGEYFRRIVICGEEPDGADGNQTDAGENRNVMFH